MAGILVLLAIVIVVGVWLWSTYNGLGKTNVRVDEAWSDITVQLKRRYDLIPNLVNTVKGYASHEKEVFQSVTEARSNALKTTGVEGVKETAKAENQFEDALKSIFAVAEAYPDLKADQNYRKLQDELTDTEDKIQASRRFYNGSVRDLNIKVKVFPTNIFARNLGFTAREFFEVDDRSKIEEPVEVKV